MTFLARVALLTVLFGMPSSLLAQERAAGVNCDSVRTRASDVQKLEGTDLLEVIPQWRTCFPKDHFSHSWSYMLEAKGWYETGDFEKTTQMIETMDSAEEAGVSIRLLHRSLLHQYVALAYYYLKRPTRSLHHFQLAKEHGSTRSANSIAGVYDGMASLAFSIGDEDYALDLLNEGLALAEAREVRPYRHGDLHFSLVVQRLDRSFRDLPIDTAKVLFHLNEARRLLQGVDRPRAQRALRQLHGYRGDLYVLAGAFEEGRRHIQRTMDLGIQHDDPESVVVAHNMFAFLELRRGDLDAAMSQIQAARRKGERLDQAGLQAITLRIQVQIAVALQDRNLALQTLSDLESLKTGREHLDLQYASLLVNRKLKSTFPTWPWAAVVLAVLSAAALVHFRDTIPTSVPSSQSLVSRFALSGSTDASSVDDACESNGSISNGHPATKGPSAEDVLPPSAGPSDDPASCPRFPVYTPSGVSCGTHPVPRFLRSRDGVSRVLVGVETEDAILVIEQLTSGSSEVAQRTDGGGFAVSDLPFTIHGVVVAELAYRNRARDVYGGTTDLE